MEMHSVYLNVPHDVYAAAQYKAELRGYLSVEEYLGEVLTDTATATMSVTSEVAQALAIGLADSHANRVVSLDQHHANHTQRRDAWITAQK